MRHAAPLELLDGFLDAAQSFEPVLDGVAVAVGWATVELDRAVAELAAATGAPADRFAAADDDQLLGARCLVARGVLADGRSLIVLEPATEGRLAATLARHGEGPAAVWHAAAGSSDVSGEAGGGNLTWSSIRSGPLGQERLLRGGPVFGPHRLLLGPPGTIRP